MYKSTKKYGHEVGLSCAFRQWKAESHCNQIHGYALSIELVFEAEELDARNWVVDFGSLKSFKATLEDTFDHKLLVAEDDPLLELFQYLEREKLCTLRILPKVGCEAFAQYIYGAADVWLVDNGYAPRVRIAQVTVAEHGANSAIYSEGKQ